MSENAPTFTRDDAGRLLVLARRAPLANFDEAEQVADLLQRFAVYAEAELAPAPVEPPQE